MKKTMQILLTWLLLLALPLKGIAAAALICAPGAAAAPVAAAVFQFEQQDSHHPYNSHHSHDVRHNTDTASQFASCHQMAPLHESKCQPGTQTCFDACSYSCTSCMPGFAAGIIPVMQAARVIPPASMMLFVSYFADTLDPPPRRLFA